MRNVLVVGVNRMTPSLLHAPPRPLLASQMVCGGPPSAPTLRNLPPAKNPISRLSGDQKGYMASSVPGKARAVAEFSARTYSKTLPFSSRAVKARCVPSGESTGGPDSTVINRKVAPGGGRIEERTTASGLGVWNK